ncbi:MAG: PKD domain-containing protein [Vicinamibacteria bacterium]
MKNSIVAGLVACGLTLQGCGLDRVETPASLIGPSELGISLQMLALPDILLADGIQTSVIRAVVRDQNGAPAAGRPIVFTIADGTGATAEIGTLTNAAGARVYGSATITTNAAGIAQVIYTTPERRDFTGNGEVVIGARVVGTDANGAPLTTLKIQLKSAEPRRFPQGPGIAPTCNFIYAPNNPVVKEGSVLRFTSTSSVAPPGFIVRSEFYFGDGSGGFNGSEGTIDVQHGFPNAGTFVVTHAVTSDTGGYSQCMKTITVVP